MKFHRTALVKETLAQHSIIPSLIPGGLRGSSNLSMSVSTDCLVLRPETERGILTQSGVVRAGLFGPMVDPGHPRTARAVHGGQALWASCYTNTAVPPPIASTLTGKAVHQTFDSDFCRTLLHYLQLFPPTVTTMSGIISFSESAGLDFERFLLSPDQNNRERLINTKITLLMVYTPLISICNILLTSY